MKKVEDIKIISTDNEEFLSTQLKFFLNKGYEPYDGNVIGGEHNYKYTTALVKYEERKEKKEIKKKVMI